jgi:Holliday junction DNA helicase RuvA
MTKREEYFLSFQISNCCLIGFLEGIVKAKSVSSIIILTSTGVGYKVNISPRLLEQVKINTPFAVFIHTHVREDQISLFGFPAQGDLDMFELLITVSGVGPKTAMNIFSVGSGEQISQAISQKNKLFFKGVSGLGSKTIEKIFLELTGKVSSLQSADGRGVQMTTNLEEAASALQNLGYQARDVFEFFRKNPGMENQRVEDVIKKFLKR